MDVSHNFPFQLSCCSTFIHTGSIFTKGISKNIDGSLSLGIGEYKSLWFEWKFVNAPIMYGQSMSKDNMSTQFFVANGKQKLWIPLCWTEICVIMKSSTIWNV